LILSRRTLDPEEPVGERAWTQQTQVRRAAEAEAKRPPQSGRRPKLRRPELSKGRPGRPSRRIYRRSVSGNPGRFCQPSTQSGARPLHVGRVGRQQGRVGRRRRRFAARTGAILWAGRLSITTMLSRPTPGHQLRDGLFVPDRKSLLRVEPAMTVKENGAIGHMLSGSIHR
jgi:hypothetical protein